MKSFTALRSLYGKLTKNSGSTNLTLGDELMNDDHREINSKKDWYWLHRLRRLTSIASLTTFTAVTGTDVCTGAAALKTDTGTRVRLTTTDTLPAGLSTGTDFFMIYQSTTTPASV